MSGREDRKGAIKKIRHRKQTKASRDISQLVSLLHEAGYEPLLASSCLTPEDLPVYPSAGRGL